MEYVDDFRVRLTKKDQKKYYKEFTIVEDLVLKEKTAITNNGTFNGTQIDYHVIEQYNNRVFKVLINLREFKAQCDLFETENNYLSKFFWFEYESEALFPRLSGLIDSLYSVLNVMYGLNVTSKITFCQDVLKKLNEKDRELTLFLRKHYQDKRRVNMSTLRNDFIHNISPLAQKTEYNTTKQQNVIIIKVVGKDGITLNDVLKVINEYLAWFKELVDKVKLKVEF